MTEKPSISWSEAFKKSPGPNSFKDSIILFIKGLCMGTADIIPGVSGGTIALITGIYADLLLAIKSANTEFLKYLLKLDFKGALSVIHIRFLVSLLSGIGIAIISLAHLMNYLLKNHPVPTWALFLGLISASILVIGKQIQHWPGEGGFSFIAGAFSGFFIVGMIPVSTPEALWFIFLSGMIAICAMILPGISGAFLLLILGKYEFVTGALKNLLDFTNLSIIFAFLCGCLVGITGFSRILSWLLEKYHNATIAFLTGLMFGSMRKIWPWKETLETQIIRGKIHVLTEKNILPAQLDETFFIALLLVAVGFLLVIFLEKKSNRNTPSANV
ncbi:MAG: DUF368 domain-containing protein [Proteobacteria bacterium]|nr:DUF368 domain-containing protein [Pseudomonadota bacterium]